MENINTVIRIIKNTIWHETRFYILIESNGFGNKLVELAKTQSLTMAEKQLENELLGYFEPLDNEMHLSGNERLRTIIESHLTA